MAALRWTRRALDALLALAVLAVVATAAVQLLAPLAGGRTLVIGGGSMEPTIGHGALVLALPAGPGGYAVGDVVTIQQGGATPYTHRITRFADLGGVAYVETKGDANAAPDPALVPTAAVIGRIAVSVPLLGYLALLLGTAAGLAGFLALCAAALFLVWLIDDLEDQRRPAGAGCPVCAAAGDAPAAGNAPAAGAEGAIGTAPVTASGPGAGLIAAEALGALPAPAAPVGRARIRDTGRARDAATPVLLERDRRDPRRHGIPSFAATPATFVAVAAQVPAPATPVAELAEAEAGDDREDAA